MSYRLGSSPRMRGALRQLTCRSHPARIIPADAGSTIVIDNAHSALWDHPRGCGEHTRATYWKMSETGSSPRMRGAHRKRLEDADGNRIIPADAGSTSTVR